MLSKSALLLAGALVFAPAIAALALPKPAHQAVWSDRTVDLAPGIVGFKQHGDSIEVRLAPARGAVRTQVVVEGVDAQGAKSGLVQLKLDRGQTFVAGDLGPEFARASELKVTIS